MTVKKHIKRIIIVLAVALLLALLIWYYMPIHISQTLDLTNDITGQVTACTIDLTFTRRIFQRANRPTGTLSLGTQQYRLIGGEDLSRGTGIGQSIDSLRGNWNAYGTRAVKSDVAASEHMVQGNYVHVNFSISGWSNALDKIVVWGNPEEFGDGWLANCSNEDLIGPA